jgi:hypothetical protein
VAPPGGSDGDPDELIPAARGTLEAFLLQVGWWADARLSCGAGMLGWGGRKRYGRGAKHRCGMLSSYVWVPAVRARHVVGQHLYTMPEEEDVRLSSVHSKT